MDLNLELNNIKPNKTNHAETNNYAALFVQTQYSLLESTIRIKKLIKDAKDFGISSIAFTDQHNLFGAMEFSLECKKAGMHGIIGCKAKVEGNREILLYCKNKTGYENLSWLLTKSYINAKNNEPYIQWNSLLKRSEGLIAIIVPSLASTNLIDLEFCCDILGDRVEWYFGIEPNAKYKADLSAASKKFQKNLVALSRACFMYDYEEKAHDAMLCIRDKRYITETDRNKSSIDFKLKTFQEMHESLPRLDFAIQNASKIAKKCDFLLEPSKPQIPNFHVKDMKQEELLTTKAHMGLKRRIEDHKIEHSEIYWERLKYEIALIINMGFAGYFLIVSDFVKFAKANSIPVGPGRGSGSGSLIAWALDITGIDPMKFGLYFERFLNPGRVSIPDFDIDFSPRGREAVIEYVREKYGKNNVAGIITFGSLSSKAVLKDVGRVLQLPYSKTDGLSKKIQSLFGRVDTLQETYDKDASFAEEINNSAELREVFEIAKILEGLYRHASAHAAGIVIRSQPIFTACPLYKDQHSEMMLTQFSMKYAEIAGLVKFDFLGLTALDVTQDTIDKLKAMGVEINLNSIPLDDPKVFEFMRIGHTKGVFQFETRGMRALIQDLKADCIEDLIAIVALYRPGPMDNIPLFIRSKEGKEQVSYKYPQIEKILENTYGVMVYQEQIIKIAQEVAGFSLADADLLRRAVGKKIPEEMASYKKQFIEGTTTLNGGREADAEEIFDQIARFANYGFNKAHAVAYAIIGYVHAYLKTHHTLIFIAVSLTLEQHNPDKIMDLIADAKGLGIKILPPSINNPSTEFTIEGDKIRYCLSAVKNIGIPLARQLREEIEARGKFASFDDLINRIAINKRQLQFLIMSGAMDQFGQNRGQLYARKQDKGLSLSLFSTEDMADDADNWSELKYLNFQKDALGGYIEKHPTEAYPLKKFHFTPMQDIEGKGRVCAIMHSASRKLDKNKRHYGICSVSDISGFYEAILPSEDMTSVAQDHLEQIVMLMVQNRKGRIVIEEIHPMSEYVKLINKLHIRINLETEMYKLKEIIGATGKDETQTEIFIHTKEIISIGFVPRKELAKIIHKLEINDYHWTLQM